MEVNAMELFLAQNHSAMTHLPIAAAMMAAVAALIRLFANKREVILLWAILSLVALVTVPTTLVTGIAAAKGRLNDAGKPYIQSGLIVDRIPANGHIFTHQVLGIGGAILACLLGVAAIIQLRGREVSRHWIALLALLLAIVWGIGGHLGGEDLWGAATFPGFQ
jgi:hypothetical protein